MIHATRELAVVAAVAALLASGEAVAQQIRAKAEVTCRPAPDVLEYDCTVTLTNARTRAPLPGVELTIGADMPSMPGAHSVAPVKTTPGAAPGTYQGRLALEMHGDWALSLNLAGPLRDRVVKVLRFEPDSVGEPAARTAPGRRPRH